MSTFFILLRREVMGFFQSALGYVVLFFLLLLTGFNFLYSLGIMNGQALEVTLLEVFFNTAIFWIGYILVFPLLTMRSFAEEFKMGTIEPLMTAPVTDLQVVAAKFFGILIFYCIVWIPSFFYFRIFESVTSEQVAVSAGPYIGSYLMLFMMGMFFISVGCLASVLTQNQIVAAVISLFAVLIFFCFGYLLFMTVNITSGLQEMASYVSTVEHMASFSRGLIDTRPMVYYLSGTALMLFLTYTFFQARRWKS